MVWTTIIHLVLKYKNLGNFFQGVKEKKRMNEKIEFKLIENPDELKDFAKDLNSQKYMGIDLESDSMYHFHEKICLLQISTPNLNAVIDTLHLSSFSKTGELKDLKEVELLAQALHSPSIMKIFHGADYDIRSIYRDLDVRVKNIFDTQLAGRFLGMEKTSLEALLKDRFGICVNKKYQKKDWSQRPLPMEMLRYAAQDAMYLIPLAQELREELNALGRLGWVEMACADLTSFVLAENSHDPLFLKFKGAGRMRSRSLVILENLLQYRMEMAEKMDRPVFKVIGNDSILRIVKARPATIRRLKNAKVLSGIQMDRFGEDVVEIVKKSLEVPEEELPVYPRRKNKRLSPKIPVRVKAIRKVRDGLAEELKIDPSMVLTKHQMKNIAIENPKTMEALVQVEGMKRWQAEAFGRQILRQALSKMQ